MVIIFLVWLQTTAAKLYLGDKLILNNDGLHGGDLLSRLSCHCRRDSTRSGWNTSRRKEEAALKWLLEPDAKPGESDKIPWRFQYHR